MGGYKRLFVRQESTDIHDASDLAGRRVAVLAGGVSIQILLDKVNTAVPVSYPRLQELDHCTAER